jgi:hypothetical protein
MLDSLHGAHATTFLHRTPEPELGSRPRKRPILLSSRFQRIAVVGPTVVLSTWLSSLGFPLLPRVALTIGIGVALILLVARHQRRARLF